MKFLSVITFAVLAVAFVLSDSTPTDDAENTGAAGNASVSADAKANDLLTKIQSSLSSLDAIASATYISDITKAQKTGMKFLMDRLRRLFQLALNTWSEWADNTKTLAKDITQKVLAEGTAAIDKIIPFMKEDKQATAQQVSQAMKDIMKVTSEPVDHAAMEEAILNFLNATNFIPPQRHHPTNATNNSTDSM